MTTKLRNLYDILVTGAVTSDESAKVREAGWTYGVICSRCKISPQYTRKGICLRCRHHDVDTNDPNWTTDEHLSR